MAFTKIVGAGIHTLSNVHTHNINSSGIITATNFVGVFSGTNGDFSGDVTIDGNLTVNGNTTTLDTTLQEVDQLFVSANNTNYAGIITQTGTGNILGLFDGVTRVFNVADGGATSTGALTVTGDIEVVDSTPRIKITDSNATGNAYAFIDGQGGQLKLFADLGNNVGSSKIIFGVDGSTPKMVIDDTGKVGIGSETPGRALTITNSEPRIRLQDSDSGGHSEIYTDDSNHLYLTADSSASAGGSRIVFQTDGANEKFRMDSEGKLSIAAGGKVGFATDSNTYFEQDGYDRLSFTVGGVKTVSMIEGTNLPVLLVDDGGVNTAAALQGAGFNANANANDIVIGNVTSGNHGLTICSPSSGYGSINFSDGSGGGLDASRGQLSYEHTPEELILRAKIGKIMLRNDSTDALVASGGKIGIGTDTVNTTQDKALTVYGTTGGELQLRAANFGGGGSGEGANLTYSYGSLFLTNNSTNGDIHFSTKKSGENTTEKMRITESGLVGIGTVNPTYPLQVHDSSAGGLLRLLSGHEGNYDLRFVYQNNETNIWSYASSDMTFGTRYAKKLHLVTNGPSKRLTINDGGYVGINSTAPAGAQLVVKNSDDSNLNAISIFNDNGNMSASLAQDSSGAGSYLQKDNAGNIKTFIRSYNTSYFLGGKVGIGTNNPLSGLHISDGTAYGSPQNPSRKATLTISAGSEGSSDIQLLSANYNHIFFGDSADPNTGIIWYEHTGSETDSMNFSTAGTPRLKIAAAGDVETKGLNTFNFNSDWSAKARNVVIFPCDDTSKWFSFVGTGLRFTDGGNFVKPSDNGNSNWGNIAGMVFEGSNNGTHPAIRFVVDQPGDNGSNYSLGSGNAGKTAAIDNNTAMLISGNGKVGINLVGSDNTSPVRNLDIADASGAILRLISTDDSLSANERLGEIEFYTDDDDGGHIGAYLKAISDPSDSFGRRTALTFGVQSNEAQNAIEKMRFTAGGQLFINSTAAVNTNDFLTIKRPAGNHAVTSMTLDATTATGSYANALIFTKSKDYYYNGLIFTSSTGHQGGLCGKMTAGGGSTPRIDLRIGGSGFNDGDNLAMAITASGTVNIGSTNPDQTTYICEVAGAYNKNGLRISSGAPNYQDPFVVATSTGGERFRITGNGLHQITTPGNTADGTYFSTLTINNTGSSTWSRLRFDRGGVARWGLALGTDDKFRISNLYTNGSTSSPDDDTFVISNSGNIDMSGYLKAKPSPGNNDAQLAKGRNYAWNATNLSPNASAGLESGWYPIMDISDGQYMFFIETGAHNSATCLVTNGYDPSQVSRINVLNSVRNNNGNYLNIQEIRVLNNGVVEVYLYASNPTYFGMNIQMISSNSMPNFYATLTKNTGSPTVDDSKDFYTYSGSVGDGLMHVESLRVDGTISKGTDNFEIPHPLPSKKDTHHLFHSMIEGPQCDNIYRGKVTLSSGAATINLDTVSNMTEGTFVLLNRDVQCFTTNETGWGAVKGSISGNILTISAQDGSSTDTISWMVVGERQDDEVKKSNSTDDDGHLIVERDVLSHDDDLTGDTLS